MPEALSHFTTRVHNCKFILFEWSSVTIINDNTSRDYIKIEMNTFWYVFIQQYVSILCGKGYKNF